MIPGNVDPRRPDKVQRYKAPSNGNAPGEDLTPDYMNILGPESTTANAEAADKHVVDTTVKSADQNMQLQQNEETCPAVGNTEEQSEGTAVITSNTTNVIPTSPQYGVAIIPTSTPNSDIPLETVTPSTETMTDSTAKAMEENKDVHSTPSRNDRFKVVKIASLEPFKRGRWKCMDYVDEAPPTTTQQTKVPPQSSGSMQMSSGIYMQTQSLPQQHIQQMLMQGFTNAAPFFQNIPSQMMQPAQFIYPQGTVPNMQQQTLPQQLVNSAGVPVNTLPQFINTTQPYFQPGMVPNTAGFTMPQNFQNLQYVPSNLLPNQNSAFVPTSQNITPIQNFQQSQTYAGQPNVTQPSVAQPLVNGHAFPQQNEQISNNLPTQAVKNAILNSNIPQQISQTQINSPQTLIQSVPNTQTQTPSVQNISQNQPFNPQVQNSSYQQQATGVPQVQVALNNQPSRTQVMQNVNPNASVHQLQQNVSTIIATGSQVNPINQQQNMHNFQNVSIQAHIIDPNTASNVYTNPQFVASVNSLPVFENSENPPSENAEVTNNAEACGDNSDDLAKTNPVVNAIDNKIEQAMDLVKSHLMYTVREEVEVLKERIAELMERIQQLETENNFLRSQIPKCNGNSNPSNSTQNGTPQDPPPH